MPCYGAFVMIRALDVNFGVCRNNVYYVLWTGVNTQSASDARFFIDYCYAVVYADCTVGADRRTRPESQTAVAATINPSSRRAAAAQSVIP